MKELQFTIEINAHKDTVWDTLWRDESFRKWAGIIDPGTYMVGDLIEGNEVQFISSENGYGVTSLVEKLIDKELLQLRHHADTQEAGTQTREKEWTGGKENYSLETKGDTTILTIAFNVPSHLEGYFNEQYPKALECIKSLAEQ